MNIAFDAKRAFENSTGLGQYSRTLINSLCNYYPDNKYFLCTPGSGTAYNYKAFDNTFLLQPHGLLNKLFKSVWRSNGIKKDLKKNGIDIYHGLSHEIPFGLEKTGIKSVVTIHDLIFEKYPDQYNRPDILIYRKKFRNSCANADKIIAISHQTKTDLQEIYNVAENKIVVCYQSCDPAFSRRVSEEEKNRIRKLYRLPEKFFLSVGSIIERKNLLLIAKAMKIIRDRLSSGEVLPVVVIGEGKNYKQTVKDFLKQHNLEEKMIFLNESEQIRHLPSFHSSEDLPAIFQQATALIYPSIEEGFGIPVLEAISSKIPVITSDRSALPEAGGKAACYIDPLDPEETAEAMMAVAEDEILRMEMIGQSCRHLQNFTPEKTAAGVMAVYKSLNPNRYGNV